MTATSESDASTENNIRIRGTLPAANYRLTICGLFFELLMTGVTNFNRISLVLLQLLKMIEQRRVELRIMDFNLFRDDRRLNLHFRRYDFQNLHKRRYALSKRHINARAAAGNRQSGIANNQRIGMTEAGDNGRNISVKYGAFFHFVSFAPLAKRFAALSIVNQRTENHRQKREM